MAWFDRFSKKQDDVPEVERITREVVEMFDPYDERTLIVQDDVALFHPGRVLDKVVGLVREITGELLDREGLKESGRLLQEKGSARLDALQAEVKAEGHNAKVSTLGKAQAKAAEAN